ncbi:MAG TPA: phytanoyl-CoA dioxygenase [Gammaproteobacteria bacterium]|jgi:ectoine hydroxylase-related dioxygenase (phytanoyl-CoA dioxygenase family)|nr:phytanoyl-CoA dioxygenase family protein [Arenicellales bacterium]MDP6552856.1 phytanoyl-CoA dioxygenase family protein [Arenicellales bacterium]MDP6791071.1 phytanoyl-CoA dioxygenase family protein [Arenicellales bacterium]MDP6919079.1 phytanoyl-CoA dioxygenase family protein [Arenicellales bacterium]HCX88075.1 phytanoyl-CoA dioxygenase [Gammaproteobacteria bacterium]|tara:strand:- start:90 stop:917 length:828 start_codon:yes stop_codon:yes gene_type:complete
MNSKKPGRLPDEVVEAFDKDGVVVLRDIFTPWVDGVRAAIEENKQKPSWRERTYRPDEGDGCEFFQDYCVWPDFAGYRALVVESPMARFAAQLMRSATARMFHDHILVKEPGNTVETPWHQDQPYYIVDGAQSVSFWVPVDPVPRERSVEYVVGSHQWGRDFKPMRFDGTDLYSLDSFDTVPDIETDREGLDIRSWSTQPGDAIAFHFKTLHGAAANPSSQRRRVVAVRWVGDDARFVARPGKTSPFFPDLNYEDGAPFGGDQFPVLCPRSQSAD